MKVAPQVVDIIVGFPIPTLTRIIGKPANDSLKLLVKQLLQNAASVETVLGGGTLGHTGLVVDRATYLLRSATPFVTPPNPGLSPIIPARATPATIHTVTNQHEALYYTYRLCRNVAAALRQQIIQAVEPQYLDNLADEHTGFEAVTPLQMIEYLQEHHGRITDTDLETNNIELKKPIDLDKSIDDFWKRVKDCQTLAHNGGAPYTDAQILSIVRPLFRQTGAFEYNLRQFNACPQAQQTLANFKTAMIKAWDTHQDILKEGATERGYSANNANATPAMEDLVLQMHQANAAMMAQMKEAHNATLQQLAKAQANATGMKQMDLLTQLLSGVLQAHPQAIWAPAQPNRANGADKGRVCQNHKYYCSTHGYGTNPTHTSLTCRNKGLNHNDAATAANPMGGNLKYQDHYTPE